MSSIANATWRVGPSFNARPLPSGREPSSADAARTLASVAGRVGMPLMTRDTEATETPALAATSTIVGLRGMTGYWVENTASVRSARQVNVTPCSPGSEVDTHPLRGLLQRGEIPCSPTSAPTTEPTVAPFESVSRPPMTVRQIYRGGYAPVEGFTPARRNPLLSHKCTYHRTDGSTVRVSIKTPHDGEANRPIKITRTRRQRVGNKGGGVESVNRVVCGKFPLNLGKGIARLSGVCGKVTSE